MVYTNANAIGRKEYKVVICNKNVKEIHKQFKKYCNNKHNLDYFYNNTISENIINWSVTDNIIIADYDNDFITEFVLNHFDDFNINYEMIEGLDNNNHYYHNFERTYEERVIIDVYFYKETQKLFEKKYAYDVEDKLNQIHLDNLQSMFEDDLECLAYEIALNKVKRSKIYNFGLGLKLNVRDVMNALNNNLIQ